MAKSTTALPEGITQEELARALALLAQANQKDAAAQVREEVAKMVTPTIAKILEAQPVKPSSKEGSTWVGSVYGSLKVTVGERTYTVQVSIKDDGASAVRKATQA